MKRGENSRWPLETAIALHQAGKLAEARSIYLDLLTQHPGDPSIHRLLGTAEYQLGRNEAAARLLEKSLQLDPRQADALNNLGVVYQNLQRLDEALVNYDQALGINPHYAEAHYNRGNLLRDLGRSAESLASYDKAIEINPRHAEAHYNRGNLLKTLKRLDESLASHDRAIGINPGYAEAHWNRSLLLLLEGKFEAGWESYEWRWKRKEADSPRSFAEPLWLGEEDIAGKTLLIYPEQGQGDFIQFIRFADLAESLGASLVVEAPPALFGLVSAMPGSRRTICQGATLPDFDCHCPVMSLPLAFRTTLDTIPGRVPYLHAPADKLPIWQQRLGAKHRPRVGLVWSGSSGHKNDHNRSIPLSLLEALIKLPYEFHSLQKEVRPEDRETLSRSTNIRQHQDAIGDFSDTAALVELMDVIVSVDTSVAHLAGAMGKEAWVLLPFIPDWRWLLDRQDSPWYPSATLFRQAALGDWTSVLARVEDRLRETFPVG